MRVRLSIFYPLSEKQLSEASAHFSRRLVREKINVVVDLRTDRIETKAIVCSFEDLSTAFVVSPLAREYLQNHVKREVARWAGREVRVLVSGERKRTVRQTRLATV